MKELRGVTFTFAFAILVSFSWGQQNHFDPGAFIKACEKNSTAPKSPRLHHLLQLAPGIRRADLQKHGINVLRWLSPAWIVVKSAETEINRNRKLFARVEAVNDNWKVATPLLPLHPSTASYFTIKTSAPAQLEKDISHAVNIVRRHGNYFIVHATTKTILDQVMMLDHVEYVALESVTANEESRVLDLNLNPNSINQIHHSFPTLNGEGMTLSIKELHYNPSDMDLQGRDIPSPLAAPEISQHATDMATIAAGAGNSFVTGKGVARAANLTSSDFVNLFPDPNQNYVALNAWVQNHSYGTVIENFYGSLAEAVDKNANELPQLLHVFSSGNQGLAAPTSGFYQGVERFANLTGNSKMSKNTLTVGCVDTTRTSIAFSSRGPAYDGRIKPEVVAYSTQGSSNAAALVSGVGVILQQAYKGMKGSLPPSALIKALIVNSAVDAGPPGIDFVTGFGNVDAYRAVTNLQAELYFSGSITQGETKGYTLSIPSNAKNLKITIVWNDPPALAGTASALVNDLDMSVNYLSQSWMPWILNTAASRSALTQAPVRGVDHLNNVEQITVPDPQPGDYAISVKGFDVPKGPQAFFIAYQWDMTDHFEWKFPTGSDNIPYDGETGTYFYWQSTFTNASGRLEYTIDNGTNWTVLSNNIDLQKGYFRWNDPPAIHAIARARMVVNNSVYITDEFSISRPARVSVGYNCEDSVMFQWPSVSGATMFRIYTDSDKYMQLFATISDTAFVIEKSQAASKIYAVQALLAGNFPAIRGPAFDYDALGTGCFLLSFFGEVAKEGIYLNVQLGTTRHIDEIIFEHQSSNTFTPIGSIEPENTGIRFLHSAPSQGINRYRVRLRFSNGEELVSDTVEDFYFSTIPFAVFPNPVSSASEVNIFSKQFNKQEALFKLFKTDGTLVGELTLITDREFIPLQGLTPGLYIYTIISEEGRFNGKLLVTD